MNPGDLLLQLHPLLALVAVVLGALALRRDDAEMRKVAHGLLVLLLALNTLALALLAYLFVITDLRFSYVTDYSDVDLPLRYRISGVWAGREGTVLIWTWAALLALNLELWWQRRAGSTGRARGAETQRELTLLIGLAVVLGLFLVQLAINPFALNSPVPIAGYGLNPLLMSPWMVVHPPLVFIAFGVVVPVFAAGLAYLVTGHREWNVTARRWARWSWLTQSAALVVGGYWAYVTLGWGGYWAWDPVETASLLPWLSITAFLHASVMFQRRGSYRVLGPLIGTLTFVLVLFESFVTRGGVWISVHAFLSGSTGGAWDRFIGVLEQDPSVKGFFILMALSLAATTVLTLRAYNLWPEPETRELRTIDDYINEETTLYAGVYLLLLITAVTLVLLLMGVNGTIPPEVFDQRLAIFTVPLAAIFVVDALQRWVDKRRLLGIVVAASGASLVLALLARGRGDGTWLVAAMLPWLPLVLWAIGRYAWAFRRRSLQPRLRAWSPYVIHLGMALLLAGYALTQGLGGEEVVTVQEGETVEVQGMFLTLEKVSLDAAREEPRLEAAILLEEGDKTLIQDSLVLAYPPNSPFGRSEVYLKRQLGRDLYLTFENEQRGTVYRPESQSTAVFTVRENPGISLVWVGSVLVMGGMLLLQATEWKPTRRLLRRLGRRRRKEGRPRSSG